MISTALAANGARVYITGRRREVLEKAVKETDVSGQGGELRAVTMDVTDSTSVSKAVEEVKSKEGYLNL